MRKFPIKLNKLCLAVMVALPILMIAIVVSLWPFFNLKEQFKQNYIANLYGKEEWASYEKDLIDVKVCKFDFMHPEAAVIIKNGEENIVAGFYIFNRTSAWDHNFTVNKSDYQGSANIFKTEQGKNGMNLVDSIGWVKGCEAYKTNKEENGIKYMYNPPISPEERDRNQQELEEGVKKVEVEARTEKEMGIPTLNDYLIKCLAQKGQANPDLMTVTPELIDCRNQYYGMVDRMRSEVQ